MADPRKNSQTREPEHDRVRWSKDEDQALEREGVVVEHDRGHVDAVRGVNDEDEATDPDSAEADIDRDDTVTD